MMQLSRDQSRDRVGFLSGRRWLLLLLLVQAILLVWSARVHSPVFDEPGHLVAGLSHWKYGRFDLYSVNPPLVRTIAAAPVHFFMQPEMDWTFYSRNPAHRSELQLGQVFMQKNGKKAYDYFFVARLAVVPIALIGTILCYLFAKEVFGNVLAGIAAAVFWAFSPDILGYGSLITPDAASAVAALASAFVLWRFLQRPTVLWAIALGCVTALAMLTRSFWLALPAVQLGVVALAWALKPKSSGAIGMIEQTRSTPGPQDQPRESGWVERHSRNSTPTEPTVLQVPVSIARALGLVVGSALLALLLVNCFYGFYGSFLPLGKYTFVSWKGTGTPLPIVERSKKVEGDRHVPSIVKVTHIAATPNKDGCVDCEESRSEGEYVPIPDPLPGNRFSGTLLGNLPVPLPRRYLEGIDIQWRDIESGTFRTEWASYFGGKWQVGGWWYFYLAGLLFKTPIVLLAAIALGVAAVLVKRPAFDRTAGLVCLLVPAIFILLLLTVNSGVHRYLRYALPVLPFLVILGSGVATWCVFKSEGRERLQQFAAFGLAMLLGFYVWGSLSVGPHWLSYFNRLAGGPESGEKWFLDSNVDWGQDLALVEKWLDEHPEARDSAKLAYFGGFNPAHVGMIYDIPLPYVRGIANRSPLDAARCGPVPGWYIVSKNYVQGHPMPFRTLDGRPCFFNGQDPYGYFREFKPVDRIGHSTLVYHLTAKDVNPVRQALGLRPSMWGSDSHRLTYVNGLLQPPDCGPDVCPSPPPVPAPQPRRESKPPPPSEPTPAAPLQENTVEASEPVLEPSESKSVVTQPVSVSRTP